ncbi:hypothetical protein CC85DRAFT_287375 [Cutaneotrichosporon oleaginosum]|uniref:N-acetyl-D-glucosamine kinase n=1 Tax=Cutaneotrichosporon oleaginosum TaxID=879819 RepID=A0A0J0XHD3_9TREE|nr:uncharacterized protein CC85DRAFT_287375 [Cutaneotrichosporon oleaginosum]KLT40535.1 hypothetical protein CC85DRAFT_287375 [Cutaneotrichosporon oleaginosum]TXT08394.1 hypothetical protein COLE_05318 [Cutaneotrichosporon oleaginosum]
MSRAATPPIPGSPTPTRPQLILCADGGGSKVMVVVRSDDGREVRGTAGPCNVQSIGHITAADRILEATYRALAQLPASHLPEGFAIASPSPSAIPAGVRSRMGSPTPSGYNTPRAKWASLAEPLFQHCWIALAGMTTPANATAFIPFVSAVLCTAPERISMTNDVNLLAAPALHLSGIDHCVAIVCGTGTIGRTIRIQEHAAHLPPSPPVDGAPERKRRGLPLADVGVSRGWGYMLCDEGSAFWIGRLAIRELLGQWDREQCAGIYSSPVPPRLPLHTDLLSYFEVEDPTELIGIVALMTDFVDGLTIGEASSKRNAYLAGAARHVFKWAFPADSGVALDSELAQRSHEVALSIAKFAMDSLVKLAIECLGDGTVVRPENTAVTLGGGLMNSPGYRELLLEGLKERGVVFRDVLLVDDAAGEGAKALATVTFK